VLAHELAHIRNRDILVSAIANVLQLSFLFGGDEDESPLGLVGSLAVMLLAPIGAMLLQLGVSRQREYLAGATAARILGDGAPLADALQAIDQSHAPALTGSRLMAPMYIVNPLAGGHLAALFSTHPPVRERIRRLRAYDGAPSPARRSSSSSRSPARAHTGAPVS
jgi:heat shock protein HtpX